MIASIRDDTWQNLQLGAGVLLRNADLSGVKTADELREAIADAMLDDNCIIGATKDGGSFACKPMLRNAEGARRTATACTMVNDGWAVRMTGTLMEITPGSLSAALGMAQVERDGGATVIRAKGSVGQEDFLPALCWVGDTSRGFMMIEMRGVMNMSGLSFRFSRNGTGEMPFELQAHAADADDNDAPCRIVLLEEETA